MKIKIRRDDASAIETNEWLEMNDWFAELRENGSAEPPRHGHPEPPRHGHPEPHRHGNPEAPRHGYPEAPRHGYPEAPRHGYPEPPGDGGPRPEAAAARAASQLTAGAEVGARVPMTERAAIGDQLRLPVAWCEMGSCIRRHADRAALGEADIRARAILAGWRVDALGRLACPRCQQSCAGFRACCPVVLWDRDTAIVRAALMTATARSEHWRAKTMSANQATRLTGAGQVGSTVAGKALTRCSGNSPRAAVSAR